MSTETKKAYTAQEAAKSYGVSADTIRAAIKRGDLTAKYPTSRPIIGADEMNSWFEALPSEAPNQ